MPSLLEYFQQRAQTFQAGSLAAYSHIWHELTSDPEILETVTGQFIELDTVPMQGKPLMQTKLSDIQTESVELEITKLLKKGVIQPSEHEAGEFISTIFTRPKKDGSHRMIFSHFTRLSKLSTRERTRLDWMNEKSKRCNDEHF